MNEDIWPDEPDLTDPFLCSRWEQQLREANPRTPFKFISEVKKICPEGVHDIWDYYCFGKRKRSWVGIRTAAILIHRNARYFSQAEREKYVDVPMAHTAANAILGILPEIQSSNKRGKEWAELGFCKLCWRLAPAGNISLHRPPLCEKHQSSIQVEKEEPDGETTDKVNPEYRRHHRLLYDFTGIPDKAKKNAGSSRGYSLQKPKVGHLTRTKDRIGTAMEWDGKLTKDKFPSLIEYISSQNGDPQNLKDALWILHLKDITDSKKNKIQNEIDNWLNSNDIRIFRTFVYAEAWLSLKASKAVGGDKKSKNSPVIYTEKIKKKAVKRALRADRPIAQVAKTMGIPETTLYTWVKKSQKSGS